MQLEVQGQSEEQTLPGLQAKYLNGLAFVLSEWQVRQVLSNMNSVLWLMC